ncbi:MAG TPA: carboxypeptidase-like regulatory domain-containing protein [Bryobacteraceae bacterium]|nr:carboxypeptidase-like regulatory domain-containing protein [Bryobacteraceae bacterium]
MKFTKQVFLVVGIAAGFTLLAGAQQKTDPDPDHKPDVFLDNHRPAVQKKGKPATSRTVSGQVVDDSGQPLDGALVNLLDTKTKEHRTYFTKKDGRYTFADLSFSVDYHIQARWKALTSDERNLSQYDHAASLVRILQVVTPEGAAPAQSANAAKETAKPKP